MNDIVTRLMECAQRDRPTDNGKEHGLAGMCIEAAREIESARRDAANMRALFLQEQKVARDLFALREIVNGLRDGLERARQDAASWEQQASTRTDDVLYFVQERDEWKARAEAAEKKVKP